MRRSLVTLLRPRPSFFSIPGRRTHFLHKIAMATSISTSQNAANGKPNHWHGAGAAEFDLRSKRPAAIVCGQADKLIIG